MAGVKLVVVYPRPRDIDDFERSYLIAETETITVEALAEV